jgi:bacterioferritin-associated ferredoxin
MIVCHCNVIACTEIRASVRMILGDDQVAVVTPGQVFKCCGARPQCGGCMINVSDVIAEELTRIST